MGRYPDDPLGVPLSCKYARLNPVLRCWSFRVGPCIVEWLLGRTNVEIRTVLTALDCIDHIVQSVPCLVFCTLDQGRGPVRGSCVTGPRDFRMI